jgi:phosphatidylethanolamine-binding protein (PEBP) family uncharacterized protein
MSGLTSPADRTIAEAINGFGKRGYGGPCPPKGHGPHQYHFRLFALDVERLPLEAKAAARCEAGAQAFGHDFDCGDWLQAGSDFIRV